MDNGISECLSVVPWEFKPQIFVLRRLAGYEEWCAIDELNDFNVETEVVDFDSSDDEHEKCLLTLDPKDWKNQDHYEVLSLKKARWRATEEQIKQAYRKKILKHHPDKRRCRGIEVQEVERDYFTCITRAFETLSDRTKRRSYDSVDPEFDDSIPSKSEVNNSNFFEKFAPVFQRNAHFSNRRPVPSIGGPLSNREDVERFYHFWYSFDSWREFSYLDEEAPEKTENRDERRYYDRVNRAERQKKRNEELKRIRQLVDIAMDTDPRINRYKDIDKKAAEDKKKARKEAARLKQEEEARSKREREVAEKLAKEEEIAQQKAEKQRLKQEKETMKRHIKQEKKKITNILNGVNYFAKTEVTRLENMDVVQNYIDAMSLKSLQDLSEMLSNGLSVEEMRLSVLEKAVEYKENLRKVHIEAATGGSANQKSGNSSASGDNVTWTTEMVQHLIKAFNLFPAGTQQRWETIASYINQRLPDLDPPLNGKQVMRKAKSIQKSDTSMKNEVNAAAYDTFSKKVAPSASGAVSDITVRYDKNAPKEQEPGGTTWSLEEQKLLEQALRTYSTQTQDKWEKISSAVGTKSKKECMLRFKELAAQVKAKKEAAAAAAASATKKTAVVRK